MNDELPRRRGLDSLKKEAKRWLAALRANAADARARLERAFPDAPQIPTLRDVQHALARENGLAGWTALKEAIAQTPEPGAAPYDTMAQVLLEAYHTGTPEAMERLYRFTWHRRSWEAMRTYVQLDAGKPDGDITRDDARYLIARDHGFHDWNSLKTFTAATAGRARMAAKPVRLENPEARSRDWDEIIRLLALHPSAVLHAEGEMTDAVLADVAAVESIGALDLSGSRAVSDAGLRHLSRLPRLEHLDLTNTAITDRGLEVLRQVPALKTISLAMTGVTDEGIAELSHCHELERVNLSWTRTGDGALRALAGKQRLRQLQTGTHVTDAGIPLLHELPVFKIWHGGEPRYAMVSYESEPNRLMLRGSFTDAGMAHLRGLDGLFGLNLDDGGLLITAAGLAPLASLPHLGWLGVDAKDDWMPYIAELPHLRFLAAQDTTAGDDGFEALSRSRTIEYIWGRRCHHLRRRGFVALAGMPALRGLSVSCLNVDDAGMSALPSFPALRELMPMDVPDAGYRHIGRCEALESLVLMYCRDTTDAATEHITGLRNLSYYFNSYTTITDRTPELLSGMDSLERITFDATHGLTNAGVARLARLPRLRELRVSARHVTDDVAAMFEPRVAVHVGG